MNKSPNEIIQELTHKCKNILRELSLIEIQIPSKDGNTKKLWNDYKKILTEILKIKNENNITYRVYTIYGLKTKTCEEVRYIGRTYLPLEKRLKHHLSKPSNPRKIYWFYQNDNQIEIFPIESNILLDEEAEYKEKLYISRYIKNGANLLNYSDDGFFKIYQNSSSIQKYPGGYLINCNAPLQDFIKVGKFLFYRDKIYSLWDKIKEIKELEKEYNSLWHEIELIKKEIGESNNFKISI